MDKLVLFWGIHIPLMLIFVFGLWVNLSIWLKGSIKGNKNYSTSAKIGTIMKGTLSIVFSTELLALLRASILDSTLHRRLLRESKLRWATHLSIFSGLSILFIMTVLSFTSTDILLPLFKVNWYPVLVFSNKDHPFTAFINDLGGLLILIGLLIAIFRRYILREPQLRTSFLDNMAILILAFILISGYAAEIARLNAEGVPPSAAYAFLGYPLAQLLKPLVWPWESIHYALFLIHALGTSVAIAYIPFSKFFHVVAGALVAAINTLEEGETRQKGTIYDQA